MPKVNVKEIREDCDKMSAGWELSPDTEFNGHKKEAFDAKRAAAKQLDGEIEEDEAKIDAKKKRRIDAYRNLGKDRTQIGKGVAGHKDFGDDSEVYGGMGFVRASERRSGLTRKKKTDGANA